MLFRSVVIAVILIPVCSAFAKNETAVTPNGFASASGVIQRVFGPQAAARFVFAPFSTVMDHDTFEYMAKGGKVMVRGNSPVALTRGAYEYLKDFHLGEASWSASRVETDSVWPDSPPVRRSSPVDFRYYLNVVTYGYTTPYWTWERWEREIDLMSLHGINLPLALVGQEAISERVWKRLGLTQEEIDASSSGPAHLPWERMGNIAGHDGPLTPSWHVGQLKLQHQILDRMKALNITPVCPAFAGFVPRAIERIIPDAGLHHPSWAGFPEEKRASFLSPDHPAFVKIGALFNAEWEKEFGKARYRISDSFNEMELPDDGRSKAELLAGYGKKIYDSVTGGDPEVTWVMQGWMFGYQRNIWTKENLGALVSRVPDNNMLLLDLAADYNAGAWRNGMNYDFYKGFFNKRWVFSVIPNMGGKTLFAGDWNFLSSGFSKALVSPNRGRLAGGGFAAEGIETNELVFELVCDSFWRNEAVELKSWLPSYTKARYGNAPAKVMEAWNILWKTTNGKLLDHPSYNWQVLRRTAGQPPLAEFYQATADFLAAGDQLKSQATYRADAEEFAALALGMRADEWIRVAYGAHDVADGEMRDMAISRALELLGTLDRLLETHPTLSLEKWLGYARAQPGTSAERDAREENARRIVTTWGPPLNDYSCRVWSGLVRDFYAPRLAAQFAAMKDGVIFDRGAWETTWVNGHGITSMEPFADPVAAAQEAIARVMAEKVPPVLEAKYEVIGEWTPGTIGTEWKDLEITISSEQAKRLRGIGFTYDQGDKAMDISNVALIADGREVALDKHLGLAGMPSRQDVYRLKIPPDATVNNSCVIRCTVRGNGGTDSYGKVRMLVN